jgi:hypothetical protein
MDVRKMVATTGTNRGCTLKTVTTWAFWQVGTRIGMGPIFLLWLHLPSAAAHQIEMRPPNYPLYEKVL